MHRCRPHFHIGLFATIRGSTEERERRAVRRESARLAEIAGEALREERRRQIARGEISPEFRGYQKYIKSAWWAALSRHTLDYLGRRCEFCRGVATQVHHVRYPKTFGTESVKSLYAVCGRCHDIVHGAAPAHASGCAFCGQMADHNLPLALTHTERRSHEVCRRCWCIGKGYRAQANFWTQAAYERWVKEWSDSFEKPVPEQREISASVHS